MTMTLMKAVLEFLGSTPLQVADLLGERIEKRLGLWPCRFPVIQVETTAETPDALPPGWSFVSLALPLEALYPKRHGLPIPQEVKQLPEDLWVKTDRGAEKLPARAAIACALKQRELDDLRLAQWRLKDSEEAAADMMRLQRQFPGVRASRESPVAILLAAAGGSTGHASLLQALDFYLNLAEKPLCMVFLLGPEGGVDFDDGKTEGANFLRLLLSLSYRVNKHPGRIWGFWVEADKRECLLQETAALLEELLLTENGHSLRRLLLDGFGIASRRSTLPGEPPRWLCRVNAFRKSIPTESLRKQKALELISRNLGNL